MNAYQPLGVHYVHSRISRDSKRRGQALHFTLGVSNAKKTGSKKTGSGLTIYTGVVKRKA